MKLKDLGWSCGWSCPRRSRGDLGRRGILATWSDASDTPAFIQERGHAPTRRLGLMPPNRGGNEEAVWARLPRKQGYYSLRSLECKTPALPRGISI